MKNLSIYLSFILTLLGFIAVVAGSKILLSEFITWSGVTLICVGSVWYYSTNKVVNE